MFRLGGIVFTHGFGLDGVAPNQRIAFIPYLVGSFNLLTSRIGRGAEPQMNQPGAANGLFFRA